MRKKRKKTFKKYNKKLKLLSCLSLAGLTFLVFNDSGLIQWLKLKNYKENNLVQNNMLLDQQIKLQNEIYKLENDEEYLEKIARERFMLVKPGEKVFRVIDTKTMK